MRLRLSFPLTYWSQPYPPADPKIRDFVRQAVREGWTEPRPLPVAEKAEAKPVEGRPSTEVPRLIAKLEPGQFGDIPVNVADPRFWY